jgi:hypothetical protein
MTDIKPGDIIQGFKHNTDDIIRIKVEQLDNNIANGKLLTNFNNPDRRNSKNLISLDLNREYEVITPSITETPHNSDTKIVLNELILDIIERQYITKTWLSDRVGLNNKTLNDKLNNDRLKAYDLLKMAKVLNIDLNELRDRIEL